MLAEIHARRNHIEQPVSIKVIDDHAASHRDEVQSNLLSDILEATDLAFARKPRRLDQVLLRHSARILPFEYVREVQRPPQFQVPRILLQQVQVQCNRLFCERRLRKRSPRCSWYQTA